LKQYSGPKQYSGIKQDAGSQEWKPGVEVRGGSQGWKPGAEVRGKTRTRSWARGGIGIGLTRRRRANRSFDLL